MNRQMHSPHFLVDPEADVIPEFREETSVTHEQKSCVRVKSHGTKFQLPNSKLQIMTNHQFQMTKTILI
jgi:hypothetical protein